MADTAPAVRSHAFVDVSSPTTARSTPPAAESRLSQVRRQLRVLQVQRATGRGLAA